MSLKRILIDVLSLILLIATVAYFAWLWLPKTSLR